MRRYSFVALDSSKQALQQIAICVKQITLLRNCTWTWLTPHRENEAIDDVMTERSEGTTMNIPQTELALIADFDPEYLRHVSDDVTAHWDDDSSEVSQTPSKWQMLTAKMKAFYTLK